MTSLEEEEFWFLTYIGVEEGVRDNEAGESERDLAFKAFQSPLVQNTQHTKVLSLGYHFLMPNVVLFNFGSAKN